MLTVTNKFHEAFRDLNREVYARIQINEMTLENDKIKSIEYSTGVFGGENYQIGSTQSATVKIVIPEVLENLQELDEIKIEIGIKIRGSGLPANIDNISRVETARVNRARLVSYIPDRFEYVPLGTFYISEKVDPDRNENITTIEARDAFIFLEGMYESEISYPAKIADVALEIANLTGSVIDPVSFSHLSNYSINRPEGYTFRQAIGLIAQFEAGFACFDRLGRIAIRTLFDPVFKIEPSEYYQKGLTKNELIYQPKGLSCKVVKPNDEAGNETILLQAGSNEGAQISIENNLMSELMLGDIFQKVKNLNFYPINLKWRGNPALEPGDWVTMTDRKGNPFKTPILNYALTFDGGLISTIGSDTKSYSANVSTFRGPLQQKLDEIDYRIDAAGKNNVYDGTEEPQHPKEGDIWFKKNGPDDEIWIYTQTEPGIFEWVLKTSTALEQDVKDKIENATPSDEIIKTINLSNELDGKEWLKIVGGKLWLTDETKIDNAIITAAMIASIDAGTINTGTLNAANVNIINLNASSISTGILNGIEIIGGTITGATIISEVSGYDYKVSIKSGQVTFKRADKVIAAIQPTIDLASNTPNGVAIVKENGEIFSINVKDTHTGASTAVFQVPKDSTLSSPKYNFYGTGIFSGFVTFKNRVTVSGSIASAEDVMWISAKERVVISGNGGGGNQLNVYGDKVNVLGDFNVYNGSKNAVHVTRDGIRATPAYEMTESYLGDMGRNFTGKDCQVWIPIDEIFSDTVNTDLPYEVFLQAYEDAKVWVSDFKSDAFLVYSDKPLVRFTWEIKAKRRGYESERLILTEDVNDAIDKIWGETNE